MFRLGFEPSETGSESPRQFRSRASLSPEIFDFLDESTTAIVTTDADGGSSFEEYEQDVSPSETLAVPVAENGGFVVQLSEKAVVQSATFNILFKI